MKHLLNNKNKSMRKNKTCTCNICFQACNKQHAKLLNLSFSVVGRHMIVITHKNELGERDINMEKVTLNFLQYYLL